MSHLPAINAGLNGLCTILLIVGLVLVKRRRIDAHRRVMLSAFGLSAVFLALYVTDKLWKRYAYGEMHTSFNGEGVARTAYFLILFSHLVLAMAVPVLAIVLIRLGLTGRFERHRRIARYAWPIWMYVSITGVVIYLMLYHFNPPVVK